MSWKSFRVAIGPFGIPDIGMWGETYQKVNMGQVERDDTGAWDPVNLRWMPVPVGGTAKPIIIHAQLFMEGGMYEGAITGNCKILRNATAANQGGPGHYEPNEPVSGVFGGFQGMGAGQMTYLGVAQPGDYFEVWTMCTAWQTGQPAISFPSYGPNTVKLNTHYAHSFMQGAVYTPDVDPAAFAALQASYTALESRVAALEPPLHP